MKERAAAKLLLVLPGCHNGEESVHNEKAEQLKDLLPETNCTLHSRKEQHVRFEKPACRLKAHDSLTTTDQHCISSILT